MQLMPTQYCHAPGRRSRRMSSASISGVAPRGPETEQCKRRRAFGGRAGARRVAFQDADAPKRDDGLEGCGNCCGHTEERAEHTRVTASRVGCGTRRVQHDEGSWRRLSTCTTYPRTRHGVMANWRYKPTCHCGCQVRTGSLPESSGNSYSRPATVEGGTEGGAQVRTPETEPSVGARRSRGL
jgi:hypothetical protein